MTISAVGKKVDNINNLESLEALCRGWVEQEEAGEALTLEALEGALGAASEGEVGAAVGRVPPERLVALGRRKESGAILESLPGFVVSVGLAWAKLPADGHDNLVGFDPFVLRVLPSLGVTLQGIHRRFAGQSSNFGADLQRRRSLAATAFGSGVKLRDQAVRAMRRELAGVDEARAALEERKGVAESAESLAGGLEGVAKEIELQRADPDRAAIMDAKRLTADYAGRLKAKAAEVRETELAAGGAVANPVSQEELDLADGRVLWVVDGVWRAFVDAAALDARVGLPTLGKMEDLFVQKAPKKAEPVVEKVVPGAE